MKIIVMTLCYNQADILPFTLRHYGAFADEIAVWDDASTDGSREILQAHPKVVLRDWPHPGTGIDEELFLAHAYEWYPKARGLFDWVMWIDPDEIVYAPDIMEILQCELDGGTDVIQTTGYNMTGSGLPQDDGRQIWEILKTGTSAPIYSKPVVFRPEVELRWNRGKHALESCSGKVSEPLLKLLHYRYLGSEYTRIKNAKNYDRCGGVNGDKGAAWSCAPGYEGEHSAVWAKSLENNAVEVL